MKTRLFLGIDPGWNGSFAIYDARENSVQTINMPDDIFGIVDVFKQLRSQAVKFAIMEKVQGYIGKNQPGSRMFRFGENFGALECCLAFFQIRHSILPPQKWRQLLGIPVRGKSMNKAEYQRLLVRHCMQLIPGCEVSIKTADSILLAVCAFKFFQ